MNIKKNIGKNTLGDGKKMQVDLRTYNRSTHDLSFAWRNTQGVGTLVPCFKQLALPGDTFDIDIDAKVMTHPTVGPLFGSFKLQVDFFVAPIRLYNAMLHNNALNIGLDMSKVKLPKMQVSISGNTGTPHWKPTDNNEYSQISPSCVLSYLGIKGFGYNKTTSIQNFNYNAVPLLGYLDIFKNYYANKQEEKYYYLAETNPDVSRVSNTLTFAQRVVNTDTYWGTVWQVTGGEITLKNTTEEEAAKGTYIFETRTLNATSMQVKIEEVEYTYDDLMQYATARADSTSWVIEFNAINNDEVGLQAQSFIRYNGTGGMQIKEADLTELDEIRECILAGGGNEIILRTNGSIGGQPQSGVISQYIADLFGTSSNDLQTRFDGQGLLLKTHQSDIFTNWINTEWVDGENGISAITAISTAGDEFTIDSLNLAKKVYDMLNRIAVSGGSYRDWIETVYTSDYTIHAETPIYEGGMSDEIVFEQVVSNSATADEPLGTLAGRGTLSGNKKGGKLHIKINEPSYIIGICSITPRVDYCQGNEWDMFLETMNDLHKPQLDGVGYQDLLERNAAWWRHTSDKTATSYGKSVAWINYMTNFNKTFGNFAKKNNEGFMVLNRYFDSANGDYTKPINATSYINPEDYNFTFADASLDAQNFWVQLGFGVKARRVMSAKQIPNL